MALNPDAAATPYSSQEGLPAHAVAPQPPEARQEARRRRAPRPGRRPEPDAEAPESDARPAKCRLALYCRVSTSGQTVEVQRDRLRAYAAGKGLAATEYADEGVSGVKGSRPALDALLAACRRGEVDLVVVTKLDRIARSVRNLVNLAAELEALAVGLVVLDQALDTRTPTGRLLFHVLGSIAEFERDLIEERAAAGREAARRKGTRFGRPRALREEERPGALARLAELRRSGLTVRACAAALKVGRSTVQRELNLLGAAASNREE